MSTHHIFLSCTTPGCGMVEQLYTGDVDLSYFPESGPDSFEGEFIRTICNDCLSEEDDEPEISGFEGTRSALDALTIRSE